MTDIKTTIDNRFGAAFATVVNEALSWEPERIAEMRDRFEAVHADTMDQYDYVTDTVYMALLDADLAEYDCDEDEDQVPAYWADLLRDTTRFEGPTQVAWAVFARDRDLIGDEDFATLTSWWVEAGLPLPERGEPGGGR